MFPSNAMYLFPITNLLTSSSSIKLNHSKTQTRAKLALRRMISELAHIEESYYQEGVDKAREETRDKPPFRDETIFLSGFVSLLLHELFGREDGLF